MSECEAKIWHFNLLPRVPISSKSGESSATLDRLGRWIMYRSTITSWLMEFSVELHLAWHR